MDVLREPDSRRALRAVVLAACAIVGCDRNKGDAASDAGPAVAPSIANALPSSSVAPSEPSAARPASSAPSLFAGEAPRTRLAKVDGVPELAPQMDAWRKHFGAEPGALVMQRVPLPSDRTVTLVARAPGDGDPMLVVAEREGAVRFSRDKPTAGMLPPAMHLALAAHELGGPMMFVYDAPTRLVAVRIWDDAGNPFADLELLDVDTCASLSAAHWPKRGYLVVASRGSSARAQLLKMDGMIALSRDGVDVAGKWRAPAPVSIALDAQGGAMLVQHATVGDKDHVMVWRYDGKLRATWPNPVDVGEVPAVKDTSERIVARTTPEGDVRIELSHGLVGSKAKAVVVASNGAVTRE